MKIFNGERLNSCTHAGMYYDAGRGSGISSRRFTLDGRHFPSSSCILCRCTDESEQSEHIFFVYLSNECKYLPLAWNELLCIPKMQSIRKISVYINC